MSNGVKDVNSAFNAMWILNHVTMEKFWEVIENAGKPGGCTLGFSSEQQDALRDALESAHHLAIRTLEKEGPTAFDKLSEFTTYKEKGQQ